MVTSMKEIACRIDRMYPPSSLRALAGRFRYPGVGVGGTLPEVSLRALAARVDESSSRRVEFLNYNTYLIKDNFQLVDVIKAVGGWERFLRCIGLGVADVLAGVLSKLGASGICDELFPPIVSACGVSLNPLNDACRLLGSVGELAGFLIEQLGGVVDAIFDLIEAPFNLIADVVFEFLGIFNPLEIPVMEAPDIDQRAIYIGDEVFKYDLVALCEVWRQEHKDSLLAQGPPVAALKGPDEPGFGDWQHMGSGLLVFSPTFTIQNGGAHLFEKTGVSRPDPTGPLPGGCDLGMIVDSDKWSRKGVQLTLVDVGLGCGNLEVYSTHLYSGGDMPDWLCAPFGGVPTDAEKTLVRHAQIAELVQFIKDTHAEGNVAMVVGDFNVGPTERIAFTIGDREYQGLQEQLGYIRDGLGFDDWYSLFMFTAEYPANYGDTNAPTNFQDLGHTNRGGSAKSFDPYCRAFPASANVAAPAPGDYYCDEAWSPNQDATGNRIDYIFVQQPVAAHGFHLDISRIRRRAFKWSGGGSHEEQFLSDHIGLELTLYVTPR